MPLVDLPLSELYRYQGRNPRPADFDAYWDRALRELDGIDPAPVLSPAEGNPSRGCDCFDLWFSSIGGAKIYAKYLRPKRALAAAQRHPAIVRFHGYSANSGGWAEKFGWPLEGFCYAAMDCRGQGGRSDDPGAVRGMNLRGHVVRGLDDPDPDRLAFRQHFLDTVQLVRALMKLPEVDPERIGSLGGSQGGGLALACAALEPRVRRVATIQPFLCDYRRIWEMDLAKDAFEELKYYFRFFDPCHEREEQIFSRLGYIDCQHLAERVKGHVLMQTGLMDTICPPSSQFAAYNRIRSPKEVVLYPDYGHEVMPGDLDRMLTFMHGL